MKNKLLLILIVVATMKGYSQQLTWTPIADLPSPRYEALSFMIGNDFYVGCGITTLSPTVAAANDLWKYESSSNSWIQKSSLPVGLNIYGANTFVINGKAYVVDGQIINGPYNSGLWQYDPVVDSWTAMASFPGTPGYTATSFSIGPYGFIGLGFMPYVNSFYCYNSLTDSWSQIASYPGGGNQGASAFVLNGKAYIGGGGVQVGSSFVNYNDYYSYDTTSGQWSPIASFPGTARRYGPVFTLNGKGYIIGGAGATSSDIYNDVWEYDPATNTWTQINNFPVSIWAAAYGSTDSVAIAGLGQNASGIISHQLWETNISSYATPPLSQLAPNIPSIWFYNNMVYVRFPQVLSDDNSFDLYDLSGRRVSSTMLQTGESSFDISVEQQSDGAYFYNVNSANGSKNYKGKMIVTH